MAEAASRILVVDDEPTIREMIGDMLAYVGYEVRSAANGREALEIATEWRPGLIVLDLMMPVMDGWTFRQKQLNRPELAGVPVIVISASRSLRDDSEFLKAAAILEKPFELQTLLRLVAQHAPRAGT